MGRIAIHGFGRIGRSTLRVALKDDLFTPVSISDIRDIPTFAALFEVGKGVAVVVVSFLALLELVRESLIEVTQSEPYAPIYVKLAHAESE